MRRTPRGAPHPVWGLSWGRALRIQASPSVGRGTPVYRIQPTAYGFRLCFAGRMDSEEMAGWSLESERILAPMAGTWGVLVDMRELKPLDRDAALIMASAQACYRDHGMVRSAVGLAGAQLKLQFERLARESGIHAYERYLDVETTLDWEARGIRWITEGVEP